jgi:hypothetical protein
MRDREDLLLDSALAAYAPPEPTPDLAARVLTSIRQEAQPAGHPPRHPRPWLTWTIAIPALAALLLVALMPAHHQRTRPASSTQQAGTSPTQQASGPADAKQITTQDAPQATTKHHRATTQPAVENEPLPRQEVFPTPTPLTPQEQALAALVSNNPGNVAQAVAESQKQPVEPLSIAAIQIPLINPPGKGEN